MQCASCVTLVDNVDDVKLVPLAVGCTNAPAWCVAVRCTRPCVAATWVLSYGSRLVAGGTMAYD